MRTKTPPPEILSFTGQLPGVDIKTFFEAASAESSVKRFIESGLLTNSARWAIEFTILAGVRLEPNGSSKLEQGVADRLRECSKFNSHRPHAATIRRVNAARELLQKWHGRKTIEHKLPSAG